MAYLSQSPIQAKQNYKIFTNEPLKIVSFFAEWEHYLEFNPNRPKLIVYTNHFKFESSMKKNQLAW